VKPNFNALFAMEPFLKLLKFFDSETTVTNNKKIMDAFSKTASTTSDPVVLNNLMHVARQLHDSIDSLSFADERRQLAALINSFIRKVDFGRDFERQLDFYVECRATFSNLDAVIDTLVLGVASLVFKTTIAVRGKHNGRTSSFVKACVAYCFITIPSIDSRVQRLSLNVLVAQAALCCDLLPHVDAAIKAAVTLVPEALELTSVSGTSLHEALAAEEAIVGVISSLISTLVTAPGHPEHGPFYLVSGLLNVIQSSPWKNGASVPTLYLRILRLLNAYGQRRLPYHTPGVDSNDVLYAADADFAEQLSQLSSQIIESLLEALAQLGQQQQASAQRAQASLALEFFDLLATCSTLEPRLATLAARLFGLAAKSAHVHRAHLKNAAAAIKRRAAAPQGQMYASLAERIAPHVR